MLIYHITPAAEWERALQAGSYRADSLESQGFIHCSKRSQVQAVAERLFRGQRGLLLLSIDAVRVEAEIRFENLEGGQEQFPHIYGPLNLAAVVRATPFEPDDDGGFTFPAGVL